MKKIILTLSLGLLTACSAQTQKAEQNDVKLTPPTDVRSGYVRLVKNVNYYIDSESIWVDNQEPQIVHFDAVVNLDKGLYVYPEPKRYARSVRQYKILNCANYVPRLKSKRNIR